MAGGRPTEYTVDMVTKAQAYLDECVDEEYQLIKSDGDKSTTFENKVRVKLPTIEGLALYLKIHRDTVYAWEQSYPEFSDIITNLRNKQAESLMNNGLSGDYNPTIAKVLLSKHGYKEETRQENDITGSVNFSGINIIKPDGPDAPVHP